MFGCTSVDLTVEQALIRRLYKRRINDCTSVESTVAQVSIERLCKRRIDDSTSVESMITFLVSPQCHGIQERF